MNIVSWLLKRKLKYTDPAKPLRNFCMKKLAAPPYKLCKVGVVHLNKNRKKRPQNIEN